ncbi:hypothetical protein NPIL_347721 [Nephila pilipes]|uniref:Uncharacterized protein n=1 Tax=Nephila pilipes TaxID=299642 RepID=A0A8X6R072_NEPPI|nr:hypothetical protein NPIL_347721 [Nephila pilipes]
MNSDEDEQRFTSFVQYWILKSLESCEIPEEVCDVILHLKASKVQMEAEISMQLLASILLDRFEEMLVCREQTIINSDIGRVTFLLTCCLQLCTIESYISLALVYAFLNVCICFWFHRMKCYRILYDVEFCFLAMYKRIFRQLLGSGCDYNHIEVFCHDFNAELDPSSDIDDLDTTLEVLMGDEKSVTEVLESLGEMSEVCLTEFEICYFGKLLGNMSSNFDYQCKPETSKSSNFDYQCKPETSKSFDFDYHCKPDKTFSDYVKQCIKDVIDSLNFCQEKYPAEIMSEHSCQKDYENCEEMNIDLSHIFEKSSEKENSANNFFVGLLDSTEFSDNLCNSSKANYFSENVTNGSNPSNDGFQNAPGTSKSSEPVIQNQRCETDNLQHIRKYFDFPCEFCHTRCNQYLENLRNFI